MRRGVAITYGKRLSAIDQTSDGVVAHFERPSDCLTHRRSLLAANIRVLPPPTIDVARRATGRKRAAETVPKRTALSGADSISCPRRPHGTAQARSRFFTPMHAMISGDVGRLNPQCRETFATGDVAPGVYAARRPR
jgi:hypothetical protein